MATQHKGQIKNETIEEDGSYAYMVYYNWSKACARVSYTFTTFCLTHISYLYMVQEYGVAYYHTGMRTFTLPSSSLALAQPECGKREEAAPRCCILEYAGYECTTGSSSTCTSSPEYHGTTGLYLYCRYCSTTVAIALYEYHCFRHSLAWLATDVSFLTALLSLV